MSAQASTYQYFAAVSPGLEALLCVELGELGLEARPYRGGVEWRGTIDSMWLVHYRSRLAESVRARLRPFHAERFEALEAGLMRLPWHAYLRQDLPVSFSVSCHKSRLYHSGAVAEHARSAIRRRLGACPEPAEAQPPESRAQEVHLRLERDEVQASVEASGELLHRRGYRTHIGEAPLRETLAAACARLLDDEVPELADAPVWDPCCGSGTLVTEWLLRKSPVSICGQRRFAFESWPIHDSGRYGAWLSGLAEGAWIGETRPSDDATAAVISSLTGRFSAAQERSAVGSDVDPRALNASKHNARCAAVDARSTWLEGDFRDVVRSIPRGHRVLSNLPYGKRLADAELARSTFVALDGVLASRRDLRPALLLTAAKLPSHLRCQWKPRVRFSNGGLAVTAWLSRT